MHRSTHRRRARFAPYGPPRGLCAGTLRAARNRAAHHARAAALGLGWRTTLRSPPLEIGISIVPCRPLLSHFLNAPGRDRTCYLPVKSRRLCLLSYECNCIKHNHLSPSVHWEGVEPSTAGFVDRHSVRLSYQCVLKMRRGGIEPPASPLSRERSAAELTAAMSRYGFLTSPIPSSIVRPVGIEPTTSAM